MEHFPEHAAAKGDFMTAVTAFDGLEQPAPIGADSGKIKSKAGVGVFETAVDETMGRWSLPILVLVDPGLAEIAVGDFIALRTNVRRTEISTGIFVFRVFEAH